MYQSKKCNDRQIEFILCFTLFQVDVTWCYCTGDAIRKRVMLEYITNVLLLTNLLF